jgi:hypothetical protein
MARRPLLLPLLLITLLLLTIVAASEDDELLARVLHESEDFGDDYYTEDVTASATPTPDVRSKHQKSSTNKQSSKLGGLHETTRGGSSPKAKAKAKSSKKKMPPTGSPAASPKSAPPQSSLEAELSKAKASTESAQRQKKQQAQQRLDEEEEQRKAARRERRERDWEAELKRMDKQSRKAAQTRRKQDKRIIDRVLKASKNDDLYAVLGIEKKWWKFWTAFVDTDYSVSSKQVKLAYRTQAKRIHPDKNKDARAEDAFDALQEAHEILGNDATKKEYDRRISKQRRNSRDDALSKTVDVVQGVCSRTSSVVGSVSRVLGPFAPSAFILVFLLT